MDANASAKNPPSQSRWPDRPRPADAQTHPGAGHPTGGRRLEVSLIRVGNEKSAQANHTYGLTTMQSRHATVSGDTIKFHFRGKRNKEHAIAVHDSRVATIIRACQHLPGHELFHYLNDYGEKHHVGSHGQGHVAAEAQWLHGPQTPDAGQLPQQLYQIVYCYGLLYHLNRPAEAMAFMARHCSEMLLLETCVSFGSGKHLNLCAETASDATQSISGTGCRPTRDWVCSELRKHFPFVYMPLTQPWHEEFPVDWSVPDSRIPLSRAVFVAGRTAIVNPLLTQDIPMLQKRA